MLLLSYGFVRGFLLALPLALTGCVNIPDSYAPPIQRKPLSTVEPRAFGHFVDMSDPNADAYILKDIQQAGEAPWRWTLQRPELKFFLDSVDNLNLKIDYAVAEATFKTTGPVTATIFLNDKPFDKVRHENHGEQHYLKAVPAALLRAKTVNTLAIEVDKVWVSDSDGARLGLILTRAGFTQ